MRSFVGRPVPLPRILTAILCLVVMANAVLTPILWTQVQAGRKKSLAVVCAANSAVIDAGRSVITGRANGKAQPPPPELERSYRQLGFPPFEVRQRQADEKGRVYGKQIAQVIARQTGLKGIARPDGSLDCKRLAQYANAAQ